MPGISRRNMVFFFTLNSFIIFIIFVYAEHQNNKRKP